MEKYPVRRSAPVPMLLYAQDEMATSRMRGWRRWRMDWNHRTQVRNVATYYSMLRFKPAGKYNVQVCTNISCMLRGAYEVYERFQDELGIGPQGSHR